MSLSIFCPNSHLILDDDQCPTCGWMRPPSGDVGQPVWGALELGAGLGGEGRGVFAVPAVSQDVVAFPLRSGEIAGLNLTSGEVRWRTVLDVGLMTRHLVADGERVLLSLCDERSIESAGEGQFVSLDPTSGMLTELWIPDAHLISAPALTGDLIILRTSASKLVALQRQLKPAVAWTRELQSWWSLAPVVISDGSGEKIVLVPDGKAMQGEGFLAAFALKDGELVWKQNTDGLISHSPVNIGDVLVLRDGRRGLTALDTRTGDLLWKRKYGRIYSNLQSGSRHVYLVVRGEAPAGEEGHYLLQALDPHTEQVVYEAPLPGRARTCRLLDEHTLLSGDDDGRLLASSTADGTQLWEYNLGSNEDPIQSELVVQDDLLLAGTYYGKVVALQVRSPEEAVADPQAALAAADFQSAADAFALSGDLGRAAEIYAQQLNEIGKALALYEHACMYHEAGELARANDMHTEALSYFEKSEDLLSQAGTRLEMEDLYGAARLYEQAGELDKAAALYEDIGELRKAFDIHKRLGDLSAILRLGSQVLFTSDDVAFLEKEGRLLEAGEAAMNASLFEKAAAIFQEAGEPDKELGALLTLVETKPLHWALERLATIARSQGRFHEEALGREKLGEPRKAAQAYDRAARQAQEISPDAESEIGDLYAKAAKLYAEAGYGKEALQCRSHVIHYRHLPQIVVTGRTTKAFREGEFNTLELIIRNVGRGVARDICVQIGGGRFEVDANKCFLEIKRLAPGLEELEQIFLRPEREQVGESVPLLLEWTWLDRYETHFEGKVSTPVPVKRLSDTSPLGTPVVIHAQTYVHGTYVGGDKVEAGAQKGDRVEIQRGERTRLHLEDGEEGKVSEKKITVLCPNCHLPTQQGAVYCNECGFELKS
jgi:outer membrane protein assembly factor BamB